jgi:hypothetical protein
VVAAPVQESADDAFLSLAPSDVLFIDGRTSARPARTSTTCFSASCRAFPRACRARPRHLSAYEYPRRWSEDVLCYWNEQYVLAALLANSSKFEILVGSYFMQNADIEALRPFGPKPEIAGVFPGAGASGCGRRISER